MYIVRQCLIRNDYAERASDGTPQFNDNSLRKFMLPKLP
jgi:hypothetical protein